MTILGKNSAYLLCDLDPGSVEDLRAWARWLELSSCEVVERDGMAAVREWLPDVELVRVYASRRMPNGDRGRLDFAIGVTEWASPMKRRPH